METGYMQDGKYYLSGYKMFSSEDKQKCVAVRDTLIERTQDRSRSAAIHVADIVKELEARHEIRETQRESTESNFMNHQS